MIQINHKHILLHLEIGIIFLIALLTAIFLASIWAKVFAGAWNDIGFIQEIAPIASFAISATTLFIVTKHLPPSRGRTFLITGFTLFTIIWFIILPVEKYSFVFPQNIDFHTLYVIFPFFFTGNILLVLSGLKMILKKCL